MVFAALMACIYRFNFIGFNNSFIIFLSVCCFADGCYPHLLLLFRFQNHGVGDGGDAPALLNGCRREQSAGGDKENPFEVACGESAKEVSAEHTRTAPGAGTAAVHILRFAREDKFAAVIMQAFNI